MFCVSQLLFIIKCQELTKATTVITIKPRCSGLILKKENKKACFRTYFGLRVAFVK